MLGVDELEIVNHRLFHIIGGLGNVLFNLTVIIQLSCSLDSSGSLFDGGYDFLHSFVDFLFVAKSGNQARLERVFC